MAKHRASCQCGALAMEAGDDPAIVVACSCNACKKRTGSAFGTVAYFTRDDVTLTGAPATWSRVAESGRRFDHFFCPDCGTTLYWTLEMRPDKIGVLVGQFDTPRPAPTRAVWTSEKLDWVAFPDHWEILPKGSPG